MAYLTVDREFAMKTSSLRTSAVFGFLACVTLFSGCTTVFSVHPGNTDVVRGKAVAVRAMVAKGTPPKTLGILTRKPTTAGWGEPIAMEPNNGDFTYTFVGIKEGFEYRLDVNAEGAGPYMVAVSESSDYDEGHKAAIDYLSGDLLDYQIVIRLRKLEEGNRENFLQGFASAFSEKNLGEKGDRYAKVLRGAIATDSFDIAFEWGIKHVNAEVTNAQVQTLIRGSIGVSGGVALGWKAGYIKGFSEEVAKKKTAGAQPLELPDEIGLYRRAESMYEALRAASGR